ncbi:hypothetical protein Dimus_014762 [Dionaea muscipula]
MTISMASTATTTSPAIFSLSKSKSKSCTCSLQLRRPTPCPSFASLNLTAKQNPRLKISRRVFWVPIVSSIDNGNSDIGSNAAPPSSPSDNSSTGPCIDLKLPRRSLLVQFTCNACGERTQRLVNRLAYERGTVFVQCAGCLQHHKLVDNLGLVVEYDFREDVHDV